ncbi:MAG: hypothetical protein AAGA56_00030 [Myxococcota bacterium]
MGTSKTGGLSHLTRLGVAIVAVAGVIGACGKPKPPSTAEVEVEPSSTVVAPEPETPPPPTCASLDDTCETDEDSLLTVPGTELVFVPPSGWRYASLEEATVVEKEAGGALIIITAHEYIANGFRRAKARSALARTLLEKGALVTQRPLQLNRPQQVDTVGEVRLSKWVAHDTEREDRKGDLLSFAGAAGDHEVVGVAFAPEDDDEAIDPILDALTTLHEGTATDGKPGARDEDEAP